MAGPPRIATHDYVALADFLASLAYPLRLELLDALRVPQPLSEVRLSPHRRDALGQERVVARQTLQAHLDKLIEADLVETVRGSVPRYVVNCAKLYELAQQLQDLSRRYAGAGAVPQTTGPLGPQPAPSVVAGPRLVLVQGVYEGKVFPLASESPEATWTLGRSRECDVALDYDSFVSAEHTLIRRAAGGICVSDAASRNGTHVNWMRLEPDASVALRTGDVLSVGRSSLVFVDG